MKACDVMVLPYEEVYQSAALVNGNELWVSNYHV